MRLVLALTFRMQFVNKGKRKEDADTFVKFVEKYAELAKNNAAVDDGDNANANIEETSKPSEVPECKPDETKEG